MSRLKAIVGVLIFSQLVVLLRMYSLSVEDKEAVDQLDPSIGGNNENDSANYRSDSTDYLYDGHATRHTDKRRLTLIVAGFQKTGTTAMAAVLAENPEINMAKKKELHFFDRTTRVGGKISRKKPTSRGIEGGDEGEREGKGRERRGTEKDDTLEREAIDTFDQPQKKPPPPPTSVEQFIDKTFRNPNPKITNAYDRNWPIDGDVLPPEPGKRLKAPLYLREGIRTEATPYYLAGRHTCRAIKSYLDNEVDDYALVMMIREPGSRAYSEYMMKQRRIDDDHAIIDDVKIYSEEVFQCAGKFLLGKGDKSASGNKNFGDCVPEPIRESGKLKKLIQFFSSGTIGPVRRPNKGGKKIEDAEKIAEGVNIDAGVLSRIVDCFAPTHGEKEGFMKAVVDIHANRNWEDAFEFDYPVFFREECLPAIFFESVRGNASAIFDEEITKLKNCINSYRDSFNDRDPLTISGMTNLVYDCIPAPARGISTEFIYRSLYAPQIYNCMKHIPKNKMFFVDNERFLRQGQAVMDEMHDWLGIDRFTYTVDQDKVHENLGKLFPTFEKNTGWTMKGNYTDMGDEVRQQLSQFFAPFNNLLFELIPEEEEKFSWDIDGHDLHIY